MKLVLVRPPFYSLFGVTTPKMKTYPLNLLYLGSYVKKNTDWDVIIFDAENVANKDDDSPVLSGSDPELVMNARIPRMEALLNNPDHPFWDLIESEIISYAPDLVGITCNSGNMDTVRIMVNRLRRRNISVVLGGSHPTALPEQSLLYTSADMAVVGEGELALVGLLRALEGKMDLSVVKSLAWKQNGEIRINPKAGLIPDINTLPIPDRSLIQRNRYYGEVLMTGRGCPFNCAYCASRNIWGRKTRLRSVDSIIEELTTIKSEADKMPGDYQTKPVSEVFKDRDNCYERPGKWVVKILDDTFTVVKSRTLELLDAIIASNLNCFEFTGGVRADTLDKTLVRKMRDANFKRVTLGVESGSPRILKSIRKGENNDHVKSAVRMLRDEGIMSHAFFMIGFPEETKEDIELSKRLILEAQPDHVEINMVTPYPGTDLFPKIIKDDPASIDRWYRWFHQGLATHSETLGYDLDEAYKNFLEFAKDYHASRQRGS
ncbi:MAG: radical SAM protein [Deltaproteobacteria bacterium]|nr:radical SAM protein [Deltaproteobacteria bacterium]